MPDIMHQLKINASPDRVYAAITTSEGIRNWWTREAQLDSTVGGYGEFRFPQYGSGYSTKVKITGLVPSLHVGWQTTASFRPEWPGTTMSFDLQESGGGTILRFAHLGFPHADDNYAVCTTGWGYYLVSLQQYLERGVGAPSPDVDFARVLG